MVRPLSKEQLDELRQFNTPTISNAIEGFDVRSRAAGFMSPQIRCIFPERGRMVGYAATGRVIASTPRRAGEPSLDSGYWRHVVSVPEPRVAVIQDVDDPPMQGAFFGDVNTAIHKALGCIGHVTNGSVRDLDEVRAMDFHFFAPGPSVSHAYVHLVEYGQGVVVGGLMIYPGDLLHADEHGVCLIPGEIADRVAEAARTVLEAESRIHALCASPDFTIEKLEALRSQRQPMH